MRVFITTTPEELEPHQAAACDVAAELGHEVVLRDPAMGLGMSPVAACGRQIAFADVLLALVGPRRGRVPSPEVGGDGLHPWVWWETRAAFEHKKPVLAFTTDEAWRGDLREEDTIGKNVLSDFRGELARLAVPFDADDDDGFRVLLRRRLRDAEESYHDSTEATAAPLRRWPPPPLPEQPYPLLLPYTHPDLLAGREREIADLRQRLTLAVPIIGLHALSGTGKSSFLGGGLVPTLRAENRPVAFERHPREPGIVRRLLGDLLETGADLSDDEPLLFVDRLRDVLRASGTPPLLVLDQFEDLLRFSDASHAQAVVGTLLAASVQRLPGLTEAPCCWLLAYRKEFHGALFHWLGNVLQDATVSLPSDLSGPDRFQAWTLSPLGTPPSGTDDRVKAASQVFRDAIEKPLGLYPWRFAGDGAARLARAFGEAREAQRNAPLAPELQVVLAHLLEIHQEQIITVPDDPAELIDRALEEHLRRALDAAFPLGRKDASKLGRTRALLALRELADVHGRRRDEGRLALALARAIGEDGSDVLEKLATPQTRLVLLEGQGDEQVYILSHDRMAEVIVRLVDDEGAYAGLGVDAKLLRLRRFVALQRELFTSGEVEQSTEVPERFFRGIKRHAEALVWDDTGQRWWTACQHRRLHDRRQQTIRRATAVTMIALLIVVVWIWASRVAKRQTLLEQIVSGDAEAAFEALAGLSKDSAVDSEEILEQLRQRHRPFDVLERGLGGVGEEHRGAALLRVAELLLPLQQEVAPQDPAWIASIVWALDFFAAGDRAAPDPTLRDQAIALRDEVLGPLRRSRPPPSLPETGWPAPGTPAADDPEWAYIPAGTFQMGSEPGEGRDEEDKMNERPRHPVTLSAFRLMVHEVTKAELHRLYPDVDTQGEDDLPAIRMTWYEAYTYAAWLGGRLPTESEWEYAARAGCPYAYCKRDGSEATLDDVAWWVGNSDDPETGEPSLRPVMRREPSPWGLYDIYGNVYEFTANWYGTYSTVHETNPSGFTAVSNNERTARGGYYGDAAEWVVAPGRAQLEPCESSRVFGLRVAIPVNLFRTDSAAR